MKFFNQLIKLELAAVVGLVAYWLYKDEREEREKKNFANLSKDELMKYVFADPKYRDEYWNLRVVMDDDAATEFVLRNWMINHGISSYQN